MKRLISIFLSLSIVLTLSSCLKDSDSKRFSNTFFDLFDTVSSIMAYDYSQNDFNLHYNQVYEELKTYSMLYDIYNSYDGVVNLKYINENAAKSPVKVDKKIMDLLIFSKKAYQISRGMVNVCLGSVLYVWHDERERGIENPDNAKLPDMDLLRTASLHVNIDSLILDEDNMTVYFADSEMKIDVGALAKGFAVEEVSKYILENNIWQSALITIGGNIKTIGFKNDDGFTPFNVGIENPNLSDYISTVALSNGMSAVTSGDYQRYYTVNGVRYCHIINPDTLMPADDISSVTVLTQDSSLADLLSTTLFNMGVEEGASFVENTDGVEAIWLDKNGDITYSSGFSDFKV